MESLEAVARQVPVKQISVYRGASLLYPFHCPADRHVIDYVWHEVLRRDSDYHRYIKIFFPAYDLLRKFRDYLSVDARLYGLEAPVFPGLLIPCFPDLIRREFPELLSRLDPRASADTFPERKRFFPGPWFGKDRYRSRAGHEHGTLYYPFELLCIQQVHYGHSPGRLSHYGDLFGIAAEIGNMFLYPSETKDHVLQSVITGFVQ